MRNDNQYQKTRYDDSRTGMRYEDSYSFSGSGSNNGLLMFLAGLGAGAALMYILDPDIGRRRRALLRDQAIGLTNDARETLNATSEDLSNRAYGFYAETRNAVTGNAVSSNQENQSNADRSSETGGDAVIGRTTGR
jgi:hypothetical protein